MHLRAGVVERRDTEEIVRPRLFVVGHLHLAGYREAAVPVENRLGEPGGPG